MTPSPKNYYGVELTKKIILEIKRLVESEYGQFMVLFSPARNQLLLQSDYHNDPVKKEMMRFFEVEGIRSVDLLEKFIQEDVNPGDLYMDRAHFSARGHKVVAELLYKILADDQYL